MLLVGGPYTYGVGVEVPSEMCTEIGNFGILLRQGYIVQLNLQLGYSVTTSIPQLYSLNLVPLTFTSNIDILYTKPKLGPVCYMHRPGFLHIIF